MLAGVTGCGALQHGRHWSAGLAARCLTGVGPYLGVSHHDMVIVAIHMHTHWCCWSGGDVAVVVGHRVLTGTFCASHLPFGTMGWVVGSGGNRCGGWWRQMWWVVGTGVIGGGVEWNGSCY